MNDEERASEKNIYGLSRFYVINGLWSLSDSISTGSFISCCIPYHKTRLKEILRYLRQIFMAHFG